MIGLYIFDKCHRPIRQYCVKDDRIKFLMMSNSGFVTLKGDKRKHLEEVVRKPSLTLTVENCPADEPQAKKEEEAFLKELYNASCGEDRENRTVVMEITFKGLSGKKERRYVVFRGDEYSDERFNLHMLDKEWAVTCNCIRYRAAP